MTMNVRVVVTAPEGRYITGYGGREQGEWYELDADTAERLVAADPGLRIEKTKTAKQPPVEES
jgi:hypothetical protein